MKNPLKALVLVALCACLAFSPASCDAIFGSGGDIPMQMIARNALPESG